MLFRSRKSKYIDLKKDVYTILPGGIHLIESLEDMKISMAKYKTCEMGKSLKKVFRGMLTVDESVALAKDEIASVFATAEAEEERCGIGYFGDDVGECPLCHSRVRRTSFGYGCAGYKEGCKFSVNISICNRVISIAMLKELVENGRTEVISGFVSPKSGKSFDAALKLENGRAVFDFERRANTRPIMEMPVGGSDQPPLPEPPPGY